MGGIAGQIEGTSVHPMGVRAGGITGWQGGGTIRGVVTKVNITAPASVGNGGIIGGPQSGSATVESAVSLSTGANANRISGWDVLGMSSSAYELETSDSHSSMNDTNADRIFAVTEEQAKEKTFYTETLGWSADVWSFDSLAADGIPALKKL